MQEIAQLSDETVGINQERGQVLITGEISCQKLT